MASSLDQYDLQGDLTTDRYMKVVFTIIALALIWLGVKDTRLEPVVSAQNQGWDAPLQEWDDDPLALGLPNPNLALPDSAAYAYVCLSRLVSGTAWAIWGDYGALRLYLRSAPNCGGDWIGSAYVFSEGATTSSSHSSYLVSEAALLSVRRDDSTRSGVWAARGLLSL